MKHVIVASGLVAALALGLGGCTGGKEPEPPAQQTLHEVMKDEIDVNADKLWDVTNLALGERAEIVPAKMSDKMWAQTEELAGKVKAGAEKLATMNPIVVAKPGVKIADEGVPYGDSAASVQANIDKNPQLLREFAGALARHMADLAAAARTHDAARAGPLIDQLDGVCEDCHLEFWYPSQKELVQQYRNEFATPPTKK